MCSDARSSSLTHAATRLGLASLLTCFYIRKEALLTTLFDRKKNDVNLQCSKQFQSKAPPPLPAAMSFLYSRILNEQTASLSTVHRHTNHINAACQIHTHQIFFSPFFQTESQYGHEGTAENIHISAQHTGSSLASLRFWLSCVRRTKAHAHLQLISRVLMLLLQLQHLKKNCEILIFHQYRCTLTNVGLI